MIEFTKAAVPVSREGPPLFLCSFSGAYFTYMVILALAPRFVR
jgi:hypothetical protein